MIRKKLISGISIALVLLVSAFSEKIAAQQPATLTLQLNKPGTPLSKQLYGLMTEEINYSYDGGLYAELIRNRIFKDNLKAPDYWSVVKEDNSKDSLKLDNQQPINDALTVCLLLDVQQAGSHEGIANAGYWGIPVRPSTVYQGSFYAKTDHAGAALDISIESKDGKSNYASAKVEGIGDQWKRYTFSLSTAAQSPLASQLMSDRGN